jgi:hypothetical protein
MKRAMGLVLAVLAYAAVAHADRIAYGSAEYAGRTGEDFWSLAPSRATSQGSNLLDERGKIALIAGGSFRTPDDPERLTDGVFYPDFADRTKTAGNSVEFDSVRRRLNGFPVTQEDGRGEHLGIVHSDPFRRAFAADEVPEPATLLLMGVGFMALAIWKRCCDLFADHSERVC